MAKPHALVVGGTGMLMPVSSYLVSKGFIVSVVARDKSRLEELSAEAGSSINPLSVDYEDQQALDSVLRQATEKYGKIDLAVVWIHKTSPESCYIVAKYVKGRYIHLLGSSAGDPANQPTQEGRREKFASMGNLRYQEVIMGFVIEPTGSRWLKKEEIQKGVIYAIEHPEVEQYFVGTVKPWSAKPS